MLKKVAYYVSPSITNEQGEFIPVIVKEGEKGYFKTNWNWGKDLAIAEECAKEKNERLGLSNEEVQKLVCQSMF
jgi:hypothetical protein